MCVAKRSADKRERRQVDLAATQQSCLSVCLSVCDANDTPTHLGYCARLQSSDFQLSVSSSLRAG